MGHKRDKELEAMRGKKFTELTKEQKRLVNISIWLMVIFLIIIVRLLVYGSYVLIFKLF